MDLRFFSQGDFLLLDHFGDFPYGQTVTVHSELPGAEQRESGEEGGDPRCQRRSGNRT